MLNVKSSKPYFNAERKTAFAPTFKKISILSIASLFILSVRVAFLLVAVDDAATFSISLL